MGQEKTYVMLDTMVYLHYQSPDQLSLPELLDVKKVEILIPRITLKELDKHKNTHQNTKIRERAKKRLSTIQNWIQAGQITPEVAVSFDINRPDINFAEYELNPHWNDDQLLAAIIQFKEHHPDERIVLLTQDTCLLLTAKHIKLEAIMVPDEKLLPQEQDPLVKENQKLSNELLRLKTARPDLRLGFCGATGESNHFECNYETPNIIPNIDKNALLDKLRASIPEIHPSRFEKQSVFEIAMNGTIPESEYIRYNRERERYFKNMLSYFDCLAEYQTQPERTFLLDLELSNIGTVPAEDVNIHIHFPDGFDLYTEDDLPGEPIEPNPPEKPKTELQMKFRWSGIPENINRMLNLTGITNVNHNIGIKDPFNLRKTNSYDLSDNISKLNHGYVYGIRKIYVIFSSFESIASFNFDYQISAANLPEPVIGTMNYVLRKNQDNHNEMKDNE